MVISTALTQHLYILCTNVQASVHCLGCFSNRSLASPLCPLQRFSCWQLQVWQQGSSRFRACNQQYRLLLRRPAQAVSLYGTDMLWGYGVRSMVLLQEVLHTCCPGWR